MVATGTGLLKIAVINDVQPQTRCRWIAPVEVEGLKAGIAHRGCRSAQGLTAAGTDRGEVLFGGMGREHLSPSDLGGTSLLVRPALLGMTVKRASRRAGCRRRGGGRRIVIRRRCGRLRRGLIRQRGLIRERVVLLRRATAGRAGTVTWILG